MAFWNVASISLVDRYKHFVEYPASISRVSYHGGSSKIVVHAYGATQCNFPEDRYYVKIQISIQKLFMTDINLLKM
jgi:hypothetical protein